MRAFVGLGSNMGERKVKMREALDRLDATPGVRVVSVSALRNTKPVGGPPQPDYLNAVAELETTLAPRELLAAALAIEREMGRVRDVRWGPRVIDIDILLCDDQVIETAPLTVPHPRMHERRFVVEPMAEIAPDVRHPKLARTMRELLQSLRRAEESARDKAKRQKDTSARPAGKSAHRAGTRRAFRR